METLDDIWADDLFGRREEAALLEAYLDSVHSRPVLRQDVTAFTLAVEANYGEGKTFFLKRFARQLRLSHPVAFVDAWADDVADEPLTALAATLQSALSPWIDAEPKMTEHWDRFLNRAGRVAKIAATGALKRGVDLALGLGASAAIQSALTDGDTGISEVTDRVVGEASKEIVDKASAELSRQNPGAIMKQRIEKFQEGKSAIREMRESLTVVLNILSGSEVKPPIVIVIDELDRCRPTYAIKMFEEIKHLFDVKGLIFVLGTNTDQLSRAVCGAYGAGFDGGSYLRRFIQRQYHLREPDLFPLAQVLAVGLPLDDRRFFLPQIRNDTASLGRPINVAVIARYMASYGVSAREAFLLFDMLQTCLDLTAPARLHAAYLLPLIIGQLKGLPAGELPIPKSRLGFDLSVAGARGGSSIQDPAHVAERFRNLSQLSRHELSDLFNKADDPEYPEWAVFESVTNDRQQLLARTANYPKLLRTVGRFENPSIAGESSPTSNGEA